MKYKKLLSVLTAVSFICSLSACKKSEKKQPEPPAPVDTMA